MKIAVITSGILPVPAIQGGAVENLIDYYLEYNDLYRLHDITIFSVWHPKVKKHTALSSTVNHYVYINTHSLWFRLCAKWYIRRYHDYYYHKIAYFLELAFRKLIKGHYDLIVLENRPGAAINFSKKTKTPIVCHMHTDLLNMDTPFKESILQATSRFLVVSDYIKQRILEVSKAADVKVVYNGLDTTRFSLQHLVAIPREQYGFNKNDFIAIYTGRIVPKKSVKELVQAMQLLTDHPDIKLLVVGGDNFADSVSSNSYLDELAQMAAKMKGCVAFTGFVPYEELPAYLAIANVAVVPSRINEAFGMTCIEATALGLPVIATNDGGIPETLVGQKHILIDKDGDLPHQIADALLCIKANYQAYTGNCLAPRFTKETYAQTFFEALADYGIR